MNRKSLTFARYAGTWTMGLVLVAALLLSVVSPAHAARAKVMLKSVKVGAQQGALTYGVARDVTYAVTVYLNSASTGDATLTTGALPAGISVVNFNPSFLQFNGTASASTILTIHSDGTTPAGSASFNVIAASQNQKTAVAPLSIGIKPLTITASSLSKVYGSSLSFAGTEFSANGLANGDQVTSVTLSSLGTDPAAKISGSPYPIVPSAAVGTGLANYSLSYAAGSLAITPKPLDVTGVLGIDKVYDGNTTATVNAGSAVLSGVIIPDVVTLNSGAAAGVFASAEVGSQSVQVSGLTLGGADAANYSVIQPVVTANIFGATATITANNAFKVAGFDDPAFGYVASGFINGDDASVITTQPTCAVSGDDSIPGTYDIVCSGAAAHNYIFSYVKGTLTVNSADNAPTDIGLSNLSVAEKQNAGALVGNLGTTDADSILGETYKYSLVSSLSCDGADNGSFSVPSYFSGGPVPLHTLAKFSYMAKNSYSICVRTDDGFGGTFDKHFTIAVLPSSVTLTSQFANDGWVLESAENSNMGGTKNNLATTLLVGDDKFNRQYRSVLSFPTGGLPDNATIYSITIKVRKQALNTANLFTQLGGLRVDIVKPAFGKPVLELTDFQAPVTSANGKLLVGKFLATPDANGWYSVTLNSTSFPYLNKVGTSQFRLRFFKDDNNNFKANTLSLYSGNAGAANRPQLTITYSYP